MKTTITCNHCQKSRNYNGTPNAETADRCPFCGERNSYNPNVHVYKPGQFDQSVVSEPVKQQIAPVAFVDPPATAKQIAYLVSLRVQISANLTKREASRLIDAAKSGDLGSFGGFYTDGSN